MTEFVLVHGSGQHAGCWERVAALLRGAGHVVVAPDLPKTVAGSGLVEQAQVVAAAVTTAAPIVVAHSLCGVLLPVVAERVPCRRLVFLAAVIPEPGVSVREQFAADPTMFHPAWLQAGAKFADPVARAALAAEFLFHDCPAGELPWSQSTVQVIDSQRMITERCPVAAWPAVPSTAIVAASDRTLTAAWCRRRARERLGGEAFELPGGHCPQNSRPTALAAMLAGLA
ncbi:MAG: alpha/beta hydrolase [Planctomycetes bacterium]|nr:alpha/beta hydrolase [Planctomycetota bacterium]